MESIQIICPPGFKIAYNVFYTREMSVNGAGFWGSDYIQCSTLDRAVKTVEGLIADNETIARERQYISIQPVFIKE